MTEDAKDKGAAADSTKDAAKGSDSGDAQKGASATALSFGEGAGASLAAVTAGDAVNVAAGMIAAAVTTTGTIVLVEDRDIAVSDVVRVDVASRLAGLGSMLTTAETVIQEASALITALPPAGGTPPPGVLRAPVEADGAGIVPAPLAAIGQIAEIVGALRSTFDIASQVVNVSRSTLVLAVAGALLAKASPPTVVLPSAGAIIAGTILASARSCMERRYALETSVAAVEAAIAPIDADVAARRTRIELLEQQRVEALAKGEAGAAQAAVLAGQIAAERTEIASRTQDPAYRTAVAATGAARVIMAAVEAAITDLSKAPESGSSQLVRAALREYLVAAATGGQVLWVDVAASGGDRIAKASPLGWNSKAAFLGGVHVAYLVVTPQGAVVAAGTKVALGSRIFDFNAPFGSPGSTFWNTWRNLKLGMAELIAVGILALVVLIPLLIILHYVFGVFA